MAHQDADSIIARAKGTVYCNASTAQLHQIAISDGSGCIESSSGALIAYSGEKTGRSPSDKRVVVHESSEHNIWWGSESPNAPLTREAFEQNFAIAAEYIRTQPQVFVQDGFINWDKKVRIKVRVVCTRAYHALFMHNMMIPPGDELAEFGQADFTIFNAGGCPADPAVHGVTSATSVAIDVDESQMVILGTEYAGEMKKGIFSVMHYLMPLRGHLTLHSGCNIGQSNDVSLFFGLSGTGKTTLSADPRRPLIGDDEHCWTQDGISNLEGGCYAKCIHLSAENEPDIFRAIRKGAVLENVVVDPESGEVDFDDASITENTRVAYPVDFISNAHIPCIGPHPRNVILLCCDAFGVLPPVARLTLPQLMFHFVSGYTAKIAGTEMGVTEPQATFSPCFGGAFLMWHPMEYAVRLAEKMRRHGTSAWFVNTGWTGGSYGVGKRMSLKHTRNIIDAIHSGNLNSEATQFVKMPLFKFDVPKTVEGVPDTVLQPWSAWSDVRAYRNTLTKLANMFASNMDKYAGNTLVTKELQSTILSGGPSADDNTSIRSGDSAPVVSHSCSKNYPGLEHIRRSTSMTKLAR